MAGSKRAKSNLSSSMSFVNSMLPWLTILSGRARRCRILLQLQLVLRCSSPASLRKPTSSSLAPLLSSCSCPGGFRVRVHERRYRATPGAASMRTPEGGKSMARFLAMMQESPMMPQLSLTELET
eukprot:313165-Hanusia_phi.AAC.3